jgi:SAM-dependent methyltransferase
VSELFAYDEVDYPSAGLPQAHPGHLYALARMFGCDPAPPERCRMLELGCGDGTHLIASAVGLPDSTFVGCDRSLAAVERGNRLIAELGLRNVSLHAVDITTWAPPPEPFDYAVAHGLYSWVPPVVRDAVFDVYRRALSPTGIGYVSYNAYPGCYIRRMVWEMLRFHTADMPAPADKIRQSVELMKFFTAGLPDVRTPLSALFGHELDEMLNDRQPAVLYHDDLGTINDPLYFHQFMAHAGRYGFRFVAEAEQNTMETRAFPPAVAGALNGMAERDVTLKEQYLDFLRLRRFRQTMLATGGQPAADPDPTRAAHLAFSGLLKADGEPVDLAPGVAVNFRRGKGGVARTDDPLGKAALVVLTDCFPKRLPFPELARRAAAKLGRPEPDAAELTTLAELLTAVWMAGLIDLHGTLPRYAETVSDRPIACPLARAQVRGGMFATTRLHTPMRFEDATSRRLVELLDGTRDREQLAAEMATAFPPDQRPDADTLRANLDRNLERMARGGLLVG